MDWVHGLAEPLRDTLLQQAWLAPWTSTIAATPDWALLSTGPAAIGLTWMLTTLFGRGLRTRPSARNGDGGSPAEGVRGGASLASNPTPSPSKTTEDNTIASASSEPAAPDTSVAPAAATVEIADSHQPNSQTPAPPDAPPAEDTTEDRVTADNAVMLAAIKLQEGDKNGAIGWYETAVSIDPGLTHAWHQLGGLYGQTERYDLSQQAFQKALETATNAGEEGVALWGLALAAVDRKDLAAAEEFFDRAAVRLEGVSDEAATRVQCARNAATLKTSRGAPEAEAALEHALTLAREHKMPEEEVQCLHGLIQLARTQGQSARLERFLPDALKLQAQLGLKRDQALSLSLLRNLAWQKKDNASARTYANQALDLLRELGDKKGEATELYWLGVVQRDDDDPSAYATFEQCLHIAEAENLTRVVIDALNKLGDFDYRADRFESAERYLNRAAELAAAAGDAQAEAIALRTLGCVAEDRGDDEAKMTHWRKAHGRATAANDQQLIGDLNDLLGGN